MKKKYKFDPTEYDFIYKVNNFDFFFFSFFLDSEYRKKDFIFTNCGNEWRAYLNKKERSRTSRGGLELIQNIKHFNNYKKKAKMIIEEAKKSFAFSVIKDFHNFSNSDLTKHILKTAKFVIKLWSIYLPTEYFYYDEVEKRIWQKIGTENYLKKLTRNVKRMQKVKYGLRTEINKTIFGEHIFYNILKEVARRVKINENRLYQLSYLEIVELLKRKRIKTTNRKEYIIGRFSKWRLITGKESRKLIKLLEDYHKQKTSNILTGQIGNRGYYIGRVKIIPLDIKLDHYKEIKKMKKGDVLVSGSTGPEMILACRKAGAIITEEGGITSHAAIVSRELGIPSVIGTKIATEALKDGDLVEVNADEGIVRIIENHV